MTAEPAGKTPFWKWPGKWVKDEKFWMDVATRTVAGILAAAFIYIFAITMGYLQSPSFGQVISAIFQSTFLIAILPFILMWAAKVAQIVLERKGHPVGFVATRMARREARSRKEDN